METNDQNRVPPSPLATQSNQSTLQETEVPSPTVSPDSTRFHFGYTYQQQYGNRLVHGKGQITNSSPVDIPLNGRPSWLVAVPNEEGSLWAVVLEDGRVQGFQVARTTVKPIAISPPQLPAGMPPLLTISNGSPQLVSPPIEDSSPFTHPSLLGDGRFAIISENGDLVFWQNGELSRLAVDSLPDGRILVDGADRLLLLSKPTEIYQHGVLGDALEAGGISLVEASPEPRLIQQIEIPEPSVIEGVSPIWADLTGDGKREIIVTLSDQAKGARIVIFNESGEQIAVGPAIGQGFRWRHQLAVAPFGPSGEIELADVLTPHIGGVVEFYRLNGDHLEIKARLSGFSSHAIRSRNLDMALAADLDGDGQTELVVPDQAQQTLNGVRRTPAGAEVAWTVPVGGRISSNLAGVSLSNGQMVLGVGYDSQMLRLWIP